MVPVLNSWSWGVGESTSAANDGTLKISVFKGSPKWSPRRGWDDSMETGRELQSKATERKQQSVVAEFLGFRAELCSQIV